jgi:hypothetical protein
MSKEIKLLSEKYDEWSRDEAYQKKYPSKDILIWWWKDKDWMSMIDDFRLGYPQYAVRNSLSYG